MSIMRYHKIVMSTNEANNILKQIIEVSDVLSRKCNSIKQGKTDIERRLKERFKPITEPSKQIINSKPVIKSEIISNPIRKLLKGKIRHPFQPSFGSSEDFFNVVKIEDIDGVTYSTMHA